MSRSLQPSFGHKYYHTCCSWTALPSNTRFPEALQAYSHFYNQSPPETSQAKTPPSQQTNTKPRHRDTKPSSRACCSNQKPPSHNLAPALRSAKPRLGAALHPSLYPQRPLLTPTPPPGSGPRISTPPRIVHRRSGAVVPIVLDAFAAFPTRRVLPRRLDALRLEDYTPRPGWQNGLCGLESLLSDPDEPRVPLREGVRGFGDLDAWAATTEMMPFAQRGGAKRRRRRRRSWRCCVRRTGARGSGVDGLFVRGESARRGAVGGVLPEGWGCIFGRVAGVLGTLRMLEEWACGGGGGGWGCAFSSDQTFFVNWMCGWVHSVAR
ncbi:hypothetical protein MMC18_004244 [Xylographa bjoerkii]|nr:hypothetical protein [Xylographa bjoerkii]